MPEIYDFSDVPDAVVSEFHRLAAENLDGTIQIAIAADVRATTLAGIFGGGSVALLAAVATIIAGGVEKYQMFVLPSVIAAICLFFGAALCAWSGRPIDFFVGGYEPKLLQQSATDLTWMLRYAAEDMQVRIDANRAALARDAKYLQCGMIAAILGVATAGIILIWPWATSGRLF